MENAGYMGLAAVYDRLTENVPYDEIAVYYNNILAQLRGEPADGALLLDMGCGTGNLTVRLARLGWDVIGSDASEDMLAAAFAKDERVRWICQSMTETELYGTVQAAVSTLDSINHLADAGEIAQCFKRLAENMESGGVFAFDVNTIYKHREILADNTFVYDLDGVYCAWSSTYSPEDDGVDIELDIFTENPDGSYERSWDGFRECALTQRELERLLAEAGFKVERVYDYLTFDPPHEKSEKLLFAARKL